MMNSFTNLIYLESKLNSVVPPRLMKGGRMIETVLRLCAWCSKNVFMVTHTEHRVLSNERDPNAQAMNVFTKYYTCPNCHTTTKNV